MHWCCLVVEGILRWQGLQAGEDCFLAHAEFIVTGGDSKNDECEKGQCHTT